ncbi:MAG: YcbK family protein [Candidatus Binatia bacterium]
MTWEPSAFVAAFGLIALLAGRTPLVGERAVRRSAPFPALRAETLPPRQAASARDTTTQPDPSGQSRFFFAGKGRLLLHHGHFDTVLDVRYRHADGSYDAGALKQIRHFFRSREDGVEAPISLRLIELLAYIQVRYHPQQMTLLSGFRSPEYNANLRAAGGAAAQGSLHTEGLAADITLAGLDMFRLWQQLRKLRIGGVGYYHTGRFLHIDTGPPRFWEETTSRVTENLSAGNARLFLRTDFDRYPRLQGALLSLHRVTAFPLLVALHATLTGPGRTTPVTLKPVGHGIEVRGGCLAIVKPARAHVFRIVSQEPSTSEPALHARGRTHLVLSTCAPRIENTPLHVGSNPIEITGR